MIKKIILVFKTHFDIGFTDLAANVIRNYSTGMLQQVIETCRSTEHLGPLKYVWTMPAWPLRYILDHCDPEVRTELERLIRNGRIVWHALPFTSHTDCCAPEEYARALLSARELSERFGKPYPIAGKMTDVPGHGLMLPELLSQAGIRFLHLGCNEFATPPDVPRLFFWQSPQGGQVLTMYSRGGYGTSLLPPKDWPFPVWMALMHTSDNCGPQTADIIQRLAEKARRAYPDAEIVCGTLDDFYRELESCDLSAVPVVNGDLADTWIHGVGSYPREVSMLRENRIHARQLHQAYAARLFGGGTPISGWKELWDEYYEQTALFEEHTWGADVKTFLGNARVYDKEDFEEARLTAPYQFMERSWKEQSLRMEKAAAVLQTADALLPAESPAEVSLCELEYAEQDGKVTVTSAYFLMRWDAASGRIESVTDRRLGAEILKSHGDRGVFSYRYDRAGIEDVTAVLRSYGYRFTDWGILDYGRVQYPECEHLTFTPLFDSCEQLPDQVRFHFRTGESSEQYGDGRFLTLIVRFPADGTISIELIMRDKQASAFIEAGSLIIPLADQARYLLGRPCAEIDPRTQIVHCANHSFYCLEDRVTAYGPSSRVTVFPADTPLMAIGSSGLYEYEPDFPEGRPAELWFDLFNNMWGTNFPQWIGGSFRWRFTLCSAAPGEKDTAAKADALELVDLRENGGKYYLILRNHSGSPAPRTIRVPGAVLRRTDLLYRPAGDAAAEELTLAVRPFGLHCVEVSIKEQGK